MFFNTRATISFTCRSEDKGVIAEPIPAKAALPEWFRKIAPIDRDRLGVDDTGLTVKRCMPFLDAMTSGWIIPLAASVRLQVRDDGRTVDAGWDFDRTMVSNHGAHQVAGNPREPRPPMKFHNHWTIRTPKGWSCLFVPPLNRPHPAFEIVSGVVDTDSYTAEIHFPFFASDRDGLYCLEKGTPIVQVIPFRRDALSLAAEIRAETADETDGRERIHRATRAGDGWYRKEARAPR